MQKQMKKQHGDLLTAEMYDPLHSLLQGGQLSRLQLASGATVCRIFNTYRLIHIGALLAQGFRLLK